jgi:predicted thioesterase
VIGAVREDEFTVEGMLLTDVGGTIPVKVLSTPGMIGMMKRCSAMLALEHLPEGVARSTLREVVDERKWRFDLEVLEGDRTLGVGTHERRTVQRA